MLGLAIAQETIILWLWEFLHWTRVPRLLVLRDSHKRVSPLLAVPAYSDSEVQTTGPLSTHSLTDKELLELYDSTDRLSLDSIGAHQKFQARAIKLVTSDAVMKMGEEVEIIATQYVRTSTVIPVPRCDRIVTNQLGETYIITEYIPGRTLQSCWDTLGWWSRFRVLITLRDYV